MMKHVFFALPLAISAQTALANEQQTNDWSYIIGFGAAYQPEHVGAKDYTAGALPFFNARYTFNENHGISLGLPSTGYTYTNNNFSAGITLGYTSKRESEDTRILTGLDDIDGHITLSPFVKYNTYLGEFSAQANIDAENETGGHTVDFAFEKQFSLSDKMNLSTKAIVSYADANHMDAYFTATENASVGRRAFNADSAGFYKYGLNTGLTYTLNQNHFISFIINADQLIGDAADSSISEENTQLGASLGYIHRF